MAMKTSRLDLVFPCMFTACLIFVFLNVKSKVNNFAGFSPRDFRGLCQENLRGFLQTSGPGRAPSGALSRPKSIFSPKDFPCRHPFW